MSEIESHHSQQESSEEHALGKPWEETTLGGEKFMVKRGLVAPTRYEDGGQQEQRILFTYDEYHHEKTGMEVKVWKLGMDKPKNQPAIVRLDYGCPCMELGTKFHLEGHDCSQQRQLMFDTIANLGIGAMATVSEKTAAGNGHGAFAVIEESTERYVAEQKGEMPPTMEESYLKRGYFPFDARRHDLVARVLADSLGDRLVIPAMSSQTKIQHLQDAGMNVVPDTRVELVSPRSEEVRSILRRDAYHQVFTSQQEPGAYLLYQQNPPLRLTPESYNATFVSPISRGASRPRRLAN